MPDRKMTNDQWDEFVAGRDPNSLGYYQQTLFERVRDEEPRQIRECVLCDEPIKPYDAWAPLNTQQYAHHECSLRMALGGIGHQLAHPYWCRQQHDPDAGLTYRQSARMVQALVDVLGVEEVARRGVAM